MTTAPEEAGGGVLPVASRAARAAPADVVPGGVLTRRAPATAFRVNLDNFTGPFDLLLGLISKHQLDITEIALAQVTDDFLEHIRVERATPGGWDLSQATEFLLVAATLLDLKAARLLPRSGPEDEEDLALIEARDLLFARLLQYRAFKDIAQTFAARMATAGRMQPRTASLEPHLAALLPELVLTVTPEQLAVIAARALTPRQAPSVGLAHLHAPAVSVREQAGILAAQLRRERVASFRSLVADAGSTLVVVARFLALLELFRESAIAFDQPEPLGELTVRWTGPDEGTVEVDDEFDGEYDEEGRALDDAVEALDDAVEDGLDAPRVGEPSVDRTSPAPKEGTDD